MTNSRQASAVVSAALVTTTTAVKHQINVFFKEAHAHLTARHETVLHNVLPLLSTRMSCSKRMNAECVAFAH